MPLLGVRKKKTKRAPESPAYEAKRKRAGARERAISQTGRDIGKLPAVADAKRRAACAVSLKLFCETYQPAIFCLPWSQDHLDAIERLEQVIRFGGQYAVSMPRGNGKTSLCEAGCLWATLYAYHQSVAIIGPEQGHAEERIESLRLELETSELLGADFPEICYPLRALAGIAQRRLIYKGKPVRHRLEACRLILPNLAAPGYSGPILAASGILGRIRGMACKGGDGKIIRPSLALIDDPQTDPSARSPTQCDERERIIMGAVLGLPGPGRRVSAMAAVTVIARDDLADRLLDRARYPTWGGTRARLIYDWPKGDLAKSHWQRYAELYQAELPDDQRRANATAYYAANRAAMDHGAQVAWPARKLPEELSALQHAYNILLERGPAAFAAEFQNEPERLGAGDAAQFDPAQLARQLSSLPMGVYHARASLLTGFIDVHDGLLYYAVIAFAHDFAASWVCDYGTWPRQASIAALRADPRTLGEHYPNHGVEAAIRAGLIDLTNELCTRQYRSNDAEISATLSQVFIDVGYKPDIVFETIAASPHRAMLLGSRGVGIKASDLPMLDYKPKPGERRGFNWLHTLTPSPPRRRYLRFDTNFWKSFLCARLSTLPGDPGAMLLPGRETTGTANRLLIDHLLGEYAIRTFGRGRTVDEWKQRADKRDNHWLDCLVGCCVAASFRGMVLPAAANKEPSGPPRKFSEWQREARGARKQPDHAAEMARRFSR